jgi:hypothetical protein
LAYSPEQLLAFRAETAAQGGHVQLVTPERLQPTRKKTKHGRTSREPNDYREPAWCRDRSHAFVLADDDRSAIAAGTAPRNVQGRKSPDWQ